MPFSEQTFDEVVSFLTFCTIPEPELGIKEIKRVLKKGGKVRMMEHVLVTDSTTWTNYFQQSLTPYWKHLASKVIFLPLILT